MNDPLDPAPAADPLPASTREKNLDVVAGLDQKQEEEVSSTRNLIERISLFFGSPAYFAFVIRFVSGWVAVNLWGWHAGWRHVDEPPFFWLQGIVSSNALLLTVAVLIRQSRMAELSEHRAHLDLQINRLDGAKGHEGASDFERNFARPRGRFISYFK
ncbi:DUF1003 domain-containing protein [Variovorax sp. J31P179]|uniref:DUF1003 domain-containing protein n=1 Tax=Variovorax sp. J31P179 TaxID=3053508 RepID=UPI0025761D52|nr:DUF1003 domain-containing protein [Variovorax sp. J31P179]MDM0084855.1 DUF1003 domain-containing protein [Variovorax sp. J31P179]